MVDICPRCNADRAWREWTKVFGAGVKGDDVLQGYEELLSSTCCRACDGVGTATEAMKRKMEGLW